MKKKFIKVILLLPIILIIIYFAYSIVQAFKNTQAGLSEILISEDKLSPNDSSLFNHEAMQEITVFEVLRSKTRNPISMVFYKENNIIFFRVDLDDSKVNEPFLSIRQKSSKQSTSHAYRLIEQQDYLTMSAKAGTILPVSKIYFSYDGESFETEMENDSIMSYRFFCENFGIKYDEDGPVDFFVEKKYLMNRPINILFWRKNKYVYVFFMTPGKKESTMKDETLLNVVNFK